MPTHSFLNKKVFIKTNFLLLLKAKEAPTRSIRNFIYAFRFLLFLKQTFPALSFSLSPILDNSSSFPTQGWDLILLRLKILELLHSFHRFLSPSPALTVNKSSPCSSLFLFFPATQSICLRLCSLLREKNLLETVNFSCFLFHLYSPSLRAASVAT